MTADATRMIAGMLAPRLGVEPAQLEEILSSARQEETMDPAAVLHFVATLLGACPICLGEHDACRECGGKGGPGSRPPEAAALVAWISPALRRLGLCVGRPRREPAAHHHGGGYG
jgi:hypothetical protein